MFGGSLSKAGIRKKLWEFWWEWAKPLLIVVAIMAPLRSVVADWNDVPSGSMRPTILVGDRIWVNKLAYDLKVPFSTVHVMTWSDPQRGDIIVFRSPADGKRLVKRVVAVPGDLVELRDDISLSMANLPNTGRRTREWMRRWFSVKPYPAGLIS
jgi:signal peptidase I